MNATWRLVTLLSVVGHAESRCSPTSYYKNCWIRRFPGIYIDVEESQRRGAQLLKFYQEDTALKCSRTCCLTRNSIFHYDATQESVNCFHLHCPTLESCILSHRGNVVLYNITKGVDPDLLVFGKYFNTNVRVLPHHYSRSNASDPLPPDKRQFIHPRPRPRPAPPAPAPQPISAEASTATLTTANRRETSNMATTSTEHSNAASATEPLNTQTTTAHSGKEHSNMATRTEHEIKHSNMATHLESPFYSTTVTPTILTPASTFKTQASSTFRTSSDQHDDRLSTTFPAPLLSNKTPETSPKSPNHSTTPGSSAMSSSDPPATVIESGKHQTNDTKWSPGRNDSALSEDDQSSAGGSGGDTWGELGPGWHVATHAALVAVAICVTVLLGCCCSVVLVFSWRGHRKRMGRYRTAWRGKRRSMRLIKYALVKENS